MNKNGLHLAACVLLAILQLPSLMVAAVDLSSVPWKLPEWSYAGYEGGAIEPVAPVTIFDATKYGADKTGINESALAIQAAVDAAASAGGGTVFLPAGRYIIELPINITSNNVVLKGAGKKKTTLFFPKSLADVFYWKKYLPGNGGNSAYCWANGFIRIWGGSLVVPNANSKLATIVAPRRRGFKKVTVDSTTKIKTGMMVWLFMSDPPTNSKLTGGLVKAVYGGYVTTPACGNATQKCFTGLDGKKNLVRWASKVKVIEGSDVIFERTLPIPVNLDWQAELHTFSPISNSGVEDLTIEFAWENMAPHHSEKGWNGVEVKNAINCWVRNVAVINSDNGCFVSHSFFVTIENVETRVTADRNPRSDANGHIGIGVMDSADVKISNFNIKNQLYHDTTVVRTTLIVWRKGAGVNLNLDAHKEGTYGTLYSDINLGAGRRPFATGGVAGRGFPIAAYTTFYNLYKANGGEMLIRNYSSPAGNCGYGGNFLFYAGRFSSAWADCPTFFVWRNGSINPADVYSYQRALRG